MTKYNIGILRVSSNKQGLKGDSPNAQRDAIQKKAVELDHELPKVYFEFIESASGEIQPSQKAIDYCKEHTREIGYAFINRIDRFTRGGAGEYLPLKRQLEEYGVQLLDVMGIIDPKTVNTMENLGVKYKWSVYHPSEKGEIMEAEEAKNDVRKILTQLIGAEIILVRKGYHTGVSDFGFQNKKIMTEEGEKTIQEPHLIESKWIIRMFELSAQNELDSKIIKTINSMGYKSRIRRKFDKLNRRHVIGYTGRVKLTEKQLHRYLKNTIYAGVLTHKWLKGKYIKTQYEGLVSIQLFNQANHGKVTIIDNGEKPGEEVTVIKGTVKPHLLKKDKFNPKFPYKFVLCPIDKKPFYASTSRGNGGYYSQYHHGGKKKNHKYYYIPQEEFNNTVNEFVKDIRFTDDFLLRLKRVILENWENRRTKSLTDSLTASEYITNVETQQEEISKRVQVLTSIPLLQKLQADYDDLEIKKQQAIQMRNQKEKPKGETKRRYQYSD